MGGFGFNPDRSPSFAQDVEGKELEMYAPYISMDDDFQLTFLADLPQEADKPSSLLFKGSDVFPAVTVSRKR